MRSRPTIELRSTPRFPRPGQRVRFTATLTGHSRTPIDRVCFHFTGQETRQTRAGKYPQWARADWFDLGSETEGLVLEGGQTTDCVADFDLPPGLPPSYSSAVSRIAYMLEVRVDIPWWPDRTERFYVYVQPQAVKAPRRRAAFHATPRDKGVQLELTVDGTGRELGGTLDGAAAVESFGPKGVRRLELCVIALDLPVDPSDVGAKEVYRSNPIVLSEGTPEAGQSYPFRLALPDAPAPTFVGRAVALAWFLEARAVVRLGKDAVLRSEIEILPASPALLAAEEPTPARIAPLGRERRAKIWATVAGRTGLQLDAAGETMIGTVGGLRLTVVLENRDDTLFPVAQLDWPPLGLGLELAERKWRDAFGKSTPLGDKAFDRRFAVRGRQADALLGPDARAALLGFGRIVLDDEGAELTSKTAGVRPDTLEAFVQQAKDAARVLGDAIAQVPVPWALAPHAAAWRAFAEKHRGQFQPGPFAIRAMRLRDVAVELVTVFDEADEPVATRARVLIAGAPTAEAKRVVASLARELDGVAFATGAVEARLPCPLPDPARAEPVWRALARVAKAAG